MRRPQKTREPVRAEVHASTPGHGPETDGVDLGEVLEFMRLLWALDHGLHATSKHMKTQLGVTSPQRLVVRMVGRFPGISAGELAKLMHVHPSTLTGVLDRLVTRGFLDRSADPQDARRALFHLTAEGRALNSMQAGTVESAVRRALGQLSRANLKAAANVLNHVTAELVTTSQLT